MEMKGTLVRLALHLQRRKKSEYRPYHLLLMPLAQTKNLERLYQGLVWLVKEGYISTILMVDGNGRFEEALEAQGVSITTVIVGRDSDEDVHRIFEDSGEGNVALVKLEREKIEGAMAEELENAVQDYVHRDMIIVGEVQQSAFIAHMLHKNSTSSIYYFLPHAPAYDDTIVKEMHGGRKNTFLIYGPEVAFERVFEIIVAQISSEAISSIMAEGHKNNRNNVRGRVDEGRIVKGGLASKIESIKTLKADVLLTATNGDVEQILSVFSSYQVVRIGEKIYYDLGMIHEVQIVLVQQVHGGAGGIAGAHPTIDRAIKALSPQYVVMVGSAFGMNTERQQIGDILVASHIQNYDAQQVVRGMNNEAIVQLQGERVPTSPQLLDLFQASRYSLSAIWGDSAPRIEYGVMLSGSRQVLHAGARDGLHELVRDAIGLEMEGAGLYSAANERVKWIVVKGIRGWADGAEEDKADEWQRLAASNAARFVLHTIQQGGFEPRRSRGKGGR